MYYSSIEQDWIGHFRQELLNKFFQRYRSKWDRESAKLLDFGAGATILNYIGAAPHVAEIFHAAHAESELLEIELWKNNDDAAHDWSPFIKYVVREIEGLDAENVWQERAEMIRSKMKIVACNIHDDYPISFTKEKSLFSIVCTSYVLEAACQTYDAFKAGIKKLVQLLRLGGYIVILLVEEETFYSTENEKWAVLPVSMEQLKEAVEEAGCVILMSDRDPTPIHLIEKPTHYNKKACVFLAAYKTKDYTS